MPPMKFNYFKLFMLSIVVIFCNTMLAQQLAFPGAEGFGKFAIGGRTGSVYHVTNLNNSGAGSLRDAVSAPNRIVVFDVAGVIRITSRIVVSNNIYIAGQTAPGEGITVYGDGWSFSGASNTICRYLKIRMGIVGSAGKDTNGLADGHDIIFDHCSVSWGRDENFSINTTTATNITIQNCIISQGLQTHSAGGLIQCDGGVTLYRNLYIDNGTRNNKVKGVSQYVNNIVYNWSAGAYIMGGESSGESFVNVTNNCFIQGPVNGVVPMSAGNNLFHIYANDNIYDNNRNGSFDPYTIPQSEYQGPPDFKITPYNYPSLPTIPANTLTSTILNDAGASLPYRDLADYYVVNELKSYGTQGALIANESSLPFGAPTSWPLWAGNARTDTDNDGMPDTWENTHGTNMAVNDAMIITGTGYTNIENYINGIDATNSQEYLRAPINLKLDSATQSSLYLSWYDYTEKELGYKVERYVNGAWVEIATTGVNGNTHTVTGLQPEESDTFRVRAFNATLNSGYSNQLIAKSKPIEVAAIDPTTFSPDLTWTGITNNDWDKTTNNWINIASASSLFTDSSKLLFPESGAGGKTVNITGQMGAHDIIVNSNGNYLINGTGYIAGTKSINKLGTGILSLQNNNTYTGPTVLRNGTFEINKLANGNAASSIGASQNYAFNWVWKGGNWLYTGGSTSTDRNVQLDATTEFNVSNAASTVTFTGEVGGNGGLTKSGPGKLTLRKANPYKGVTTIKGGTLEISPISAALLADNIINNCEALGSSNILNLEGGTFKTINGSTSDYENYPLDLYVANNTVNGFEPYRNANIAFTVHGSGTLNYAIPYLRELIQGDWSDFTGTLVANGINTTDGSLLMIDNGEGFANARVVTAGNTKITPYSNQKTIYLGGLAGPSGTMLSCGGTKTASFGFGLTTYVVGGANTNETFSGVINNQLYGSATSSDGETTIEKIGNGYWKLTGTNTYSGTTTVVDGSLIVNGANNGAGAVTVADTATLAGTGSVTGDVTVAGTLQPGDASINTFTLKNKLVLQPTAVVDIEINKNTSAWDKLTVTSNITYNGTLKINFTGTPASGDTYKIFTTAATTTGDITNFIPAIPGPGLTWKFKPATGELQVQAPNYVETPTSLTLNASTNTALGNSTINCTWVDNSNNETEFILERSTDGINFVDVAHPAANTTTFADNPLLPNTLYFYRIKAQGTVSQSAYSNIASVTTPALASLPTMPITPSPANNATNVFLTNNKINLTWVSNYADSFAIYLGTTSGLLVKIDSIAATASNYLSPVLNPNTKYFWRIEAFNTNGTVTSAEWNFKTANVPTLQTGDYRSSVSGNWGSTGSTPLATAIWETYDGTSWVATTIPPPSTTNTISIKTGHTVTLNATSFGNNIVVESGAILKSGLDAASAAGIRNIRVGTSINNFGTVGSSSTTNEKVNFQGYKTSGQIFITGTSTYFLSTFTVNNIATTVEAVIDANLNLVSYMRANFDATTATGTNQNDDNITITINVGKTVTMGSSSYLQVGSSPTTNTVGEFGNYTYNINGTLDMRSTGTSCIVQHLTLNNTTTLNVNGTWLTGNAMRLITSGTVAPIGTVSLNIGTNGTVDAGARTIGTSSAATNLVVTNAGFTTGVQTVFFNINADGKLRNKVATADVLFPIGTNGTYSPVKISNTGTADIFNVGVKNGFDYPVNTPLQVVNKQVTITPTTIGVTNAAVSVGWLTADQSSAFNPAGSVVLGRHNGTAWVETAATVSGTGTIASPYYAKASGYTNFSPFVVGNANTITPLHLLSFGVTKIANNAKVTWTTTNEDNVQHFEIERSNDVQNFIKVGQVNATNNAAFNQYNFLDYTPIISTVFYRLKTIDNNGQFYYSKIVKLNFKENYLLKIFPNPVTNEIVLMHPLYNIKTYGFIYNAKGQLIVKIALEKNATQTLINAKNLAKGVYFMKINNNQNLRIKFEKQ